MKIVEISYRSLRTGRGYNNSALEAKAAVQPGESAEIVLMELRHWVDKKLDDTLKREDAYEDIDHLEARKTSLKGDIERLEKRADAFRDLMRQKQKLAALARDNNMGGDALLLDDI